MASTEMNAAAITGLVLVLIGMSAAFPSLLVLGMKHSEREADEDLQTDFTEMLIGWTFIWHAIQMLNWLSWKKHRTESMVFLLGVLLVGIGLLLMTRS